MGFSADLRAASVAFMTDYTTANAGALRQIYPARPATLYAPCGWVDRMSEPNIDYSMSNRTREPLVEVVVLHGLFDSEEAVTQRDAFVDGFHDWVRARFHQAGAATLVALASMDDDPNYQPDWIQNSPFYFATRITLRGHSQQGGFTI